MSSHLIIWRPTNHTYPWRGSTATSMFCLSNNLSSNLEGVGNLRRMQWKRTLLSVRNNYFFHTRKHRFRRKEHRLAWGNEATPESICGMQKKSQRSNSLEGKGSGSLRFSSSHFETRSLGTQSRFTSRTYPLSWPGKRRLVLTPHITREMSWEAKVKYQ